MRHARHGNRTVIRAGSQASSDVDNHADNHANQHADCRADSHSSASHAGNSRPEAAQAAYTA